MSSATRCRTTSTRGCGTGEATPGGWLEGDDLEPHEAEDAARGAVAVHRVVVPLVAGLERQAGRRAQELAEPTRQPAAQAHGAPVHAAVGGLRGGVSAERPQPPPAPRGAVSQQP